MQKNPLRFPKRIFKMNLDKQIFLLSLHFRYAKGEGGRREEGGGSGRNMKSKREIGGVRGMWKRGEGLIN